MKNLFGRLPSIHHKKVLVLNTRLGLRRQKAWANLLDTHSVYISGIGFIRDCATTQRNHGLAAFAPFGCNNEVADARTADVMVHAAAVLAYCMQAQWPRGSCYYTARIMLLPTVQCSAQA